MVNQKDKQSVLTYGPSRSGSGCKKRTLYFCLKRGNRQYPGVPGNVELKLLLELTLLIGNTLGLSSLPHITNISTVSLMTVSGE